MIEFHDPFRAWFRGLSKPMQWLLGPPIIVACLWATWQQLFEPQTKDQQEAFWFTLLLFVVSVVLSELMRPKPNVEQARPKGLGDFQFPTTTEGRVVPLIWGRVRQRGPNVVWYGDLLQDVITEDVKTGLWSSDTITKGFSYHLGVQYTLCRGGGDGVTLKRVWIGEDEVFSGTVSTETFFDVNKPELFGGNDLGSGGVQATCDFYTGAASQTVNAYLDVDDRQRIASAITPTAPAYNGDCYVVAREMTSAGPLSGNVGAYLGNSTTIKPWSFEIERYPSLFGAQGAGENKIGVDANPINVAYEILTDQEWGFRFPDTDIDLASFLAAADTMITEVNGFSMLLDREMPAKEMLSEIQRQIEGVVFLSQATGLWTVKLARADYDIDLIPQLDEDNVVEVRDYVASSWDDTTNTISVQYDKRDDDYKLSFALAQDMANAISQGDGTVNGARSVTGQLVFPGCKSSDLAANLAWRELRGQSYPLKRVTVVVNRQMWELSIGDVVAWSNVRLFGAGVKFPMRINKIDYGRLQNNKMTLTLVQDVFKFAAASMGSPAATAWTPPVTSLIAYPAAQITAQECPRAILVRDPKFQGDDTATKIFCAARRQSSEVIFQIKERHASGTPAGTFAVAGQVYGFTKIGQLDSALNAGTAIPTASLLINATPDGQTALEAAFDDDASLADLGQQLVQLILVGDEFILVPSASTSGADVDLENVYRGVLDTAQMNHAVNTDVFLLHLGAGVTDTNFVNTHNVDIELRMRSSSAIYAGAVTPIALTMAKRTIRPYSPAAIVHNGGSVAYNTPDLEDNGTGENGQQFAVDWWRRRFDTTDEVAAMLADDSSVDASTEYQLSVFVDPDGVNTEIASSPFAWQTGAGTIQVPRNEILEIAAAGTEIRLEIEARHDILTETNLTSRYVLQQDVVPDTVNSGLFYLGGNLGPSTGSNSYTTAASGVFTVRIGAAYSTSVVEHRINGGSWTTIIAASATSGVTASLTATDTIELRHTVSEGPDPQFIEIENPSVVRVAYGTLSA